MLTQDATLRAKALLKGATKPIRIFLGFRGIGQGQHQLVAQLDGKDMTRSMPWTETTVPHTLDPEQLAQALQDTWARLHGDLTASKGKPSSIPDRRHNWRRDRSFAKRKA